MARARGCNATPEPKCLWTVPHIQICVLWNISVQLSGLWMRIEWKIILFILKLAYYSRLTITCVYARHLRDEFLGTFTACRLWHAALKSALPPLPTEAMIYSRTVCYPPTRTADYLWARPLNLTFRIRATIFSSQIHSLVLANPIEITFLTRTWICMR